jgi:hypothetical protein
VQHFPYAQHSERQSFAGQLAPLHCDHTPIRESARPRGALFRTAERLREAAPCGGVANKLFPDCQPLQGCVSRGREKQTGKLSVGKESLVGLGRVGERGQSRDGDGSGGCGRMESWTDKRIGPPRSTLGCRRQETTCLPSNQRKALVGGPSGERAFDRPCWVDVDPRPLLEAPEATAR